MLYIFDWDGTLCNSLDLITDSIRQSCEKLGLPVRSVEESRAVIGLGLKEAMMTLYPELPVTDIDDLIDAYRHVYVADNRQQPSKLYDGVIEVLDELRSSGHELAIATGKSRVGLDRVLVSLDMQEYFDFSRCADETRSKPHPMMLNEIMRESGVPPESTTMVGDTDFDLNMARAASVSSVAVSYGAHSAERIQAASPDRIIDHLSELLPFSG